jgi:hypothetical protein
MKKRVRLLRAMLEDGMYPIDELAIADAIVARAQLRLLVPEVELAQDRPGVRSFRHDPSARSFRLTRPPARIRVFH